MKECDKPWRITGLWPRIHWTGTSMKIGKG